VGTLGGIALIVGIVAIAGVIAYIGDRVGHQVGRKRLTLFNLRPKYTSTIVAVGTGMMIALAVTTVVLLSSNYARAAFFHLDEINNKVNQLQAQADSANKQLRESNIVINRGDLLYDQFLMIEPRTSEAEKLKSVSAFFDAVVQSLDRRYVPLGLKPYPFKSNDADVRKKLQDDLLDDERVQGFLLQGPVIVLSIADQNLFVNDPIHFGFQPYLDHQIFRAHQPIARLEVDGGSQFVPRIAYTQLSGAVQDAAIGLGMPGPFARALTTLDEQQVETTSRAIRTGHGRYYLVVQAAIDVYPHTGGIPVEFVLSRTPK
jgi:tetrahydromethanopterin S-methyltransferase subunit B